ncbi:MAG TPA: SIMPL domain-containing protein [Bacilli bacterium]
MNAKKTLFVVVAAALALFIALPFVNGDREHAGGNNSVFAQSDNTDARTRTISVTGEGEIKVEPDVAYVSIGVQTEAATANEAQTANADAFADLQKMLANYAVDKKDIKTTNFSVQPQYQYGENQKPKIVGYTATHMIEVTYRKLDMLGAMLDDLSKAGANRVNNIRFGTEKQHEYELQALDKAMDNARAKANALAKNAGGSVKGVLNITQNGSSGPPQIYTNITAAAAKSLAAADTTTISSGQLTIQASVSVQFAF